MQATRKPCLVFNSDPRRAEFGCVFVRGIEPELIAVLGKSGGTVQALRSVFSVKVIGPGMSGDEEVPDVLGRRQILPDGIRFVPHFPFTPGVRYRASFDPRPLRRGELSETLTLDFSLTEKITAELSAVTDIFPSSDLLPENLLRFYICFSNSMQRGQAKEQIRLLGPDGEPAQDVLYHAPVELWDRSMRHLTILLDPGRLKRGVGPNRELGPPLRAGQNYTLAVGSGMVDLSGRPLQGCHDKRFRVSEAVRERISVDEWRVLPPVMKSRQPLALRFPKPLDWALLWHAITITSESGRRINGRITIDDDEKRWNFTPASPWIAELYHVQIAPGLEDVCGNNLRGAFDGPFRTIKELALERSKGSISFRLV